MKQFFIAIAVLMGTIIGVGIFVVSVFLCQILVDYSLVLIFKKSF